MKRVLDTYNVVSSHMVGRIGMTENEINLITDVIQSALGGDYIEIGTLWGGSICCAALTYKWLVLPGRLYTIDLMDGDYWRDGDPSWDLKKPTPGAIRENLEKFWVENLVTPIRADSKSIPLPLTTPNIIMIDGDHSYIGALADWAYASQASRRYILFHDYAVKYEGVNRLVNDILNEGLWRQVALADSLIALERPYK